MNNRIGAEAATVSRGETRVGSDSVSLSKSRRI
jgi:hypothetical protein